MLLYREKNTKMGSMDTRELLGAKIKERTVEKLKKKRVQI